MKKLQNNYTTPEQSKRLLELGVPADSADCYYNFNYFKHIRSCYDMANDLFERHPDIYPCWSVGRLMEIYEICTGEIFERNDIYNIFSDIFTTIESALLNHKMDFSKLEDEQ